KERRNGKMTPRRLDPSFGPVITSAIRVGDSLDGDGSKGRGFYIEDAGISYLFGWIAELSGLPGTLIRGLKFLKMRAKYRTCLKSYAHLSAEIANLLGPATTMISMLALIAMGRDFANGRLSLKGKFLECDWTPKKSQAYFYRVRQTGKAMARALNGK